MLTPSDIEAKTFHTSLRGYDLDEVDDFLDEVVATVRELTERLDAVGSTDERHSSDEGAVGRALVAAQSTADQIINDAKEEAEQILESATAEAESWAAARDEKKAAAEEEMALLADRVANVRKQLEALTTAVADKIDEMDVVLESGTSDVPEDVVEEPNAGTSEVDPTAEIVDTIDLDSGGYIHEDHSSDGKEYELAGDVEDDARI